VGVYTGFSCPVVSGHTLLVKNRRDEGLPFVRFIFRRTGIMTAHLRPRGRTPVARNVKTGQFEIIGGKEIATVWGLLVSRAPRLLLREVLPRRQCDALLTPPRRESFSFRLKHSIVRQRLSAQPDQLAGCLFFLAFAHLARAAFLAISLRFSAVIFLIRALPPSCPK